NRFIGYVIIKGHDSELDRAHHSCFFSSKKGE
ncbi:MAG: hypothetical protein ACI978_002504, partial [Oleispira sp.]